MNEKDERLAEFCKAHGCSGIWIRRRSNIAWATDGADVHVDGSASLGAASLLWTPGRKMVLTTNIEAARLAAEEPLAGWEIVERPWFEDAPALPDGLMCDYPDDPLTDLRAELTEAETRRLRALGGACGEVMGRVLKTVQRGWSELDVAAELGCALGRQGIACPVLLVAADDRIARYRHPIPTAKRIEKVVMGVICAQRHGLIVALTRLVHFGALPDELRRKHDAVCRVDERLHAATQPGVRWSDILAEGIQAYREGGFDDEWRLHHQGGPMGYEPRDYLATAQETRCVRARQAVGWNPSITGTKSEDTILSGGEILTGTPDWPMKGRRPDILVRLS